MITIDLITGFLGSGKTTFLRKYVKYLLAQGENICILENDYGAVNVDMMLISDLLGDHCDMEMVSGGCDSDCHRRRFKSKLIEMGMIGYTHVLVEPSGVFDVDEFYDSLSEEPLNRWYKAGAHITIVDAGLRLPLSDTSRYVFASEAANAGVIVFSKTQLNNPEAPSNILKYLNESLASISCRRKLKASETVAKDWNDLTDEDFKRIESAGFKTYGFEKQQVMDEHKYESLYFMEKKFSLDQIKEKASAAINDPECGGIIRIKGFFKDAEKGWMEVNVTKDDFTVASVENGQDIVIVIGEKLGKEKLAEIFGEPAEVHAD
ncbi:MAG: GTPase (G3E family) [Lachnospiraceae bacterium]|nr:MAG: GTPase (G3E family) [Lachnospiraceae bacterium]